jgi:excisionase family DNA binding protein
MEKLLDITQASEALGLKRSTLYKLTTTRGIPYIKLGSRVLFAPSSLERWTEERSVPVGGQKNGKPRKRRRATE